jgi:ribonuclease BN (tRNA processing enzyme)
MAPCVIFFFFEIFENKLLECSRMSTSLSKKFCAEQECLPLDTATSLGETHFSFSDKTHGDYELTFQGGGLAGVSSALLVSVKSKKSNTSCRVLFDAGGLALPREVTKQHNNLPVLITHLHPDHCSGTHTLVSSRSLCGMSTKIFLPSHACVEDFKQILMLQEKIGRGAQKRYDYRYTVTPVTPLTRYNLPLNREVVPFPTCHTIASVGYAVVQRHKKLKAEMVGRKDIAKLKDELGESAVFDFQEIVEIAYTGDTTIDVFTALELESASTCSSSALSLASTTTAEVTVETVQSESKQHPGNISSRIDKDCCDEQENVVSAIQVPSNLRDSAELLQKALVIVTECTFVDDENPPAKAKARGHIHLKDIATNAHLFQSTRLLVLTHFSQKYDPDQVKQAVKESLPDWLFEKTALLFLWWANWKKNYHDSEQFFIMYFFLCNKLAI